MKHSTRIFSVLASTVIMSSTAIAGGFDRGGVKIDQLFDTQRYSMDSELTFVFPQRTIENVTRSENLGAGFGLLPQTTSSIDVDNDHLIPRFGLKAGFGDSIDCLASYSQPFGADANYGTNNAYSPTTVEFKLDSEDYGLTCSYKFKTSIGQFRAIVGGSYIEVEAFQSRQTFGDLAPAGDLVLVSPLIPALNSQGLGTFELSDEAFGWRVGAAYEIPKIALRASLVYNSRYSLSGLEGVVDGTGLGGIGALTPVSASTEIPQSVEFKFQSGIAENTLLFGSFKWQQWSRLGVIPIFGVTSPTTGLASDVSFDPLYRDGITASVGVGRRFSDELSGLVSLGYDRGTSTTTGTQTDTYTVSGGLSYNLTENLEFKAGGLLGLLTSGSSAPSGGDPANDVSFTFDDDFVGAINVGVKVKF